MYALDWLIERSCIIAMCMLVYKKLALCVLGTYSSLMSMNLLWSLL